MKGSMADQIGKAGLQFLGRFKDGQPDGHFWLGLINNGFIHGKVDENGLGTSEHLAFIYPDGETALRGQFNNLYMKKAKHVDVLKYGCDENGMFIATEFTDPLVDYEFFYEPCTNSSFGGGSKEIQDPYEFKNAKVGISNIPDSGDGVILKRDVSEHKPVCYFSLFLYREMDQVLEYHRNCKMNKSKSDDYRRHCVKYCLGTESYHAQWNLPPEYDENPLPNLGPKVNHHFTANNSFFKECEHPRWGLISSIIPELNLKLGDELLAYYGYDNKDRIQQEFPDDFPWYWEKKRQIEKEENLRKKTKKKSKKGK